MADKVVVVPKWPSKKSKRMVSKQMMRLNSMPVKFLNPPENMETLKKKLFRTKSVQSQLSSDESKPSGKPRGRRGAVGQVHIKRTTLNKELLAAVNSGDATKIREILEIGVDLNDFDDLEKAFRMACEKGHLDLVSVLIRYGAPINTLGNENSAPLHVATRHGHLSVMMVLISNGASVNIQTKYEKRTPFHVAAMVGREDSMKTLISSDSSANLDQPDIYGTTPLHLAARMSRSEIAKILLSHRKKVDVNAYDKEGWTAMHFAAERGDCEMMQLLIKSYAQVDCQNKFGKTPLHWATIKNHTSIVQLLLRNKCSALIRDLENKMALEYARDPVIKQMLKMTASAIYHHDNPPSENTISDYLKLGKRGSFIKRIDQPIPKFLYTVASIKRRCNNGERKVDNLVAITEESEVASSRKSSLHSDEDLSTDQGNGFEDSLTRSKSPFARSFSPLSRRDSIETIQSTRSAPITRQGSGGSLPPNGKSSVDGVPPGFVARSRTLPAGLGSGSVQSVNEPLIIPTSARPLQSQPHISDSQDSQDSQENDSIPPEAMMGIAQFKSLKMRIARHQQAAEVIINSMSLDVAQAATGRKQMSNDDMMNLSNRLHKLQNLMFDFREEIDRQSDLIHQTMQSFLATIKKRLSPKDILPLHLYHYFLLAAIMYISEQSKGWMILLHKLTNVSEIKRSDLIFELKQKKHSDITRASRSLGFALSTADGAHQELPIKSILTMITRCQFEPNSAQKILLNFFKLSGVVPEDVLRHDNLYILSYRLHKDGAALASHLGVSFDENGDMHDCCLGALSRWRQDSTDASSTDVIHDLIEALIVIGREDLLMWILVDQKNMHLKETANN